MHSKRSLKKGDDLQIKIKAKIIKTTNVFIMRIIIKPPPTTECAFITIFVKKNQFVNATSIFSFLQK